MTREQALTAAEVADYCDVSTQTVMNWVEYDSLTSYRGADTTLIPAAALREFLQSQNLPLPSQLCVSSHRVLVVDDEEAMTNAIERRLKRAGYTVETAYNGMEAGSKLQSFKPILLILDLRMPKANGFDVLHYLKSAVCQFDVKTLIISAEPIAELRKSITYGADDTLAKPFDNNALIEKVTKLIGKPNNQ